MKIAAPDFPEAFVRDVTVRLKRVEGQVKALRKMLEDGRDCEDVVQQVSAATRALDRLGVLILATAMERCVAREARGEKLEGTARDKLRRLFLTLR